jgi:hypothetical protein
MGGDLGRFHRRTQRRLINPIRCVGRRNARYIATQFEWIADYELTENLALNASYAAMPAGPFIRETGRSDTIHFVGLKVLLVF